MEPGLDPEQRERIIDALMDGRKIEAIKVYRDEMGVSLKEAKEYVEGILDEVGKDHPEVLAANRSGCAATLLFFGFAAWILLQSWMS